MCPGPRESDKQGQRSQKERVSAGKLGLNIENDDNSKVASSSGVSTKTGKTSYATFLTDTPSALAISYAQDDCGFAV